MTSPAVFTETRDRVLIVRLSNPDKLNAWTTAQRDLIRVALKAAEHDDTVGAVVMTGAGNEAFCAGQDLEESMSFTDASWTTEMETLFDQLRRYPKPVVAAVNGVAAGSGFQLALLCDIRVGWAGSRMGQTELNHDIPSITGTWLMANEIGMARTRYLVLLGKLMSGEEAYEAGFLHEFVDSQEAVLARAVELSALLAERDGVAFRTTKDWMRAMSEGSFRRAFDEARSRHEIAFASGSAHVGIQRFLRRSDEH
ncbi:enoyl-CoA hydratase/isomerase family protein [Bradyrhizobium diazoefficiens]|nr:enoyl-CoA hydratase/isomerase family protein [Bradyrhizobium diazoefficiens]QQO23727.1 enoyl-CoA hydratase/isomerase family protein [Bradyrhizobium diazoefficiens]